MQIKYLSFCLLIFLVSYFPLIGQGRLPKEKICGQWELLDKTLIITVSMHENQFKAVITWFSDTEGKPLDYWTDIHNPNPALRKRKIHGMSILRNLTYHPKTNSWEEGMIYDSIHGREWNASAYIDKNGQLKVKGYWHFKFIGRTMTFRRI